MSKTRKPIGNRVRLKPKKAVASKPPATKSQPERRVAVSTTGTNRKRPQATMASPPSVAVAAAPESEAPRTITPLAFWTQLPFAIMDIWFSKSGRENKRTGA